MPKDKRILNIGCGERLIPNAVNIDTWPGKGVQVCDITNGLPFEDNEFDEAIADYVLCQICDKEKFRFVMNSVWRVLKPGGLFKIKVPNAEFPESFRDPMDCRYFIPATFTHFDPRHYRFRIFHYGFKPWKILKLDRIGNQSNPQNKNRLYVEMQKIINETNL